MKLLMAKTMGGQLAPINDQESGELAKLKVGNVLEVTIVRKRNPEFHRRFFALLQVGFDAWTEVAPIMEYHGEPVLPNADRFRKDVTILAGFYDPTFNLKGELRLEAKSISFASMDQDEFEKLYSSVIDVLLRRVLSAQGYTADSLREHVDRVLTFDR